jgi:hypothetical protein
MPACKTFFPYAGCAMAAHSINAIKSKLKASLRGNLDFKKVSGGLVAGVITSLNESFNLFWRLML